MSTAVDRMTLSAPYCAVLLTISFGSFSLHSEDNNSTTKTDVYRKQIVGNGYIVMIAHYAASL